MERESKGRWRRHSKAQIEPTDLAGVDGVTIPKPKRSEAGGGPSILGGNPELHFITAKLVLSKCKLLGRWLSGRVRYLPYK